MTEQTDMFPSLLLTDEETDTDESEAVTFSDWLEGGCSTSVDGLYRHQLLIEKLELRSEVLFSLKCFVGKAHEDARRHLQRIAGLSLDPLNQRTAHDPADGYPALLHIDTLKGYFGEVLAGLVSEHFAPHDEDRWKVPAHLFRFHNVAFQQLEKIRQTGKDASRIPGRPGDDCLAFVRDGQGVIIRALFCEAKCTQTHRSDMIRKAHEGLSDSLLIPVSLREVIEVLRDNDDPEADEWIDALRQLLLDDPSDGYERYDLVTYVCGQRPKERRSWIPAEQPPVSYSGGRRLEAVEIHLNDVEGLVREVYRMENDVPAN